MDLGLHGRVAVITGASRGLGKSIARALAEEGADVAICARDEVVVKGAADDISAATGVNVLPHPADLASEADLDALVEATMQRFDRIDVLIHVAGGPVLGPFASKSREEWDHQLNVHFHSLRHLLTRVVPIMRRRGWGRIVAVTSRTIKQPRTDNVVSGAVRLPGVSVLRALADEHGPHGLTFNTLCPGPFATDRLLDVCEQLADQEGTTVDDQLRRFGSSTAVGRVGNPDELAAVATFLSSDKASYVTGQVIMVDGGSVRTMF
jgi:3-oxoacyl-[acyl-carrier protein] reductase